MKNSAQVSEKLETVDFLNEMEALSREIETAVAAIAANKLPALEESLWKQREHTARCEAALLRSAPLTAGDARLESAARRLRTSTDKYAAVLFHAGQSLEMLFALHRTNTGAACAGTDRSGWYWQG